MTELALDRREALKAGGGFALIAALAAAGVSLPTGALANWNEAAFQAKTLEEALKALGVDGSPGESGEIKLVASDIAENGAVVPVGAVSSLPKTEQIALLIENNPSPMAAAFDIPEGTMADVSTRVKMGKTSNVYALVKADGKFYMAGKEIKVTLGGCGG